VQLQRQHELLFPRDPNVRSELSSNNQGMVSEYKLLTCHDCGLTYASPMLAASSRWYELAYRALGVKPEPRWEFDVVLQHLVATDRVYEIGCGTGMFLRMCRDKGIAAFGIDFSEYSIDACLAQGLNAAKTGIAIGDAPPDWRDASAVVSFHVLEHVGCPDDLFRHAYEASAKKATLWVSVPSGTRVSRICGFGEPMDEPPHHLTKWTERAFAESGRRQGWRLEAMILEPFTWRFALWSVASQYKVYRALQVRGHLDTIIGDRLLRALLYPSAMLQLLVNPRRRSMSGSAMLARFSKL
jgi:SAM-dependent methyltransferase